MHRWRCSCDQTVPQPAKTLRSGGAAVQPLWEHIGPIAHPDCEQAVELGGRETEWERMKEETVIGEGAGWK